MKAGGDLKRIRILSNILFGIGAAMAALALYLTISLRLSLPPGVCPIENHRPLIFASIGVLAASLVLTLIVEIHKKRSASDKLDKLADHKDDTRL